VSAAASVVAWAIALAPRPSLAAAAPADRERLLTDAQEHRNAGDHRAAAESYADYYRALGDDRTTTAGENAVLAATDAYRSAWKADHDRADLLASQALLQAHIADFEATRGATEGEGVDEARLELQWVREQLETSEPDATPVPPTTVAEPDPTPAQIGPERPPSDRPRDDPAKTTAPASPRLDRPGLALSITGGALTATGAVLLGWGGLWGPAVDRAADSAVPGSNVPMNFDSAAWASDQRKTGTRMLIAGGVLAGVGLPLLVYGVVRLVRGRRPVGTASLRFAPRAARPL
jgi:hypothetical protein